LFVTNEPFYIQTILGSCVAVCLYDQVKRIAGMNHYMLPLWNGQGLASPKYGNIAIEKLLEKVISYGSHKSNLIAKLFGGADIISTQKDLFKIGSRNIELGISMLRDYNIPVVSSSLGGKQGRKIHMSSITGEVQQKMIVNSSIMVQ
jgi:chemotaxis protein CheD